jgi:hypothetical protein
MVQVIEQCATERIPVQTHRLHISNARDSVLEIRSELFVFPEVLEVFVTGRPDVLVVVCSGRPRPTQWLRTLHAAGYETLARRHASANKLERGGPTSARDVPRSAPSPIPTEPPVRRVRPRRSSGVPKLAPTTSTWSRS